MRIKNLKINSRAVSLICAGTLTLSTLTGCGSIPSLSKTKTYDQILEENEMLQERNLSLEEQIESLENEKARLELQISELTEEKSYNDEDVYVVTRASSDGTKSYELVTLESRDAEIINLLPYLDSFSDFFKNSDFYQESKFLGVQEKQYVSYYSVFNQKECGYSVRLKLVNNSKGELIEDERKDYVVGYYDYYNFGEETSTSVSVYRDYKLFFSETTGDSVISIQTLKEVIGIEDSKNSRTVSELQDIKDTLNKNEKVLAITSK